MNSAGQTVRLERGKQSSAFWPTQILGPRPGLREMNLVCWGMFIAFLLIPLCVFFWIQAVRGTLAITQLRSDFVYFYGDGKIAREYPADRIYDPNLQLQIFRAIYPSPEGDYGPSPYPPFVPLFFEPLAHLSFRPAFTVWLGISLILYLIGIGATTAAFFPGERSKTSLVFCFALAFFPFLFGTLLNGQLAAIAVCSVGLAVSFEQRGSLFWSGFALALLTYKPTLLPLLLLMLLLTRRFRTLLGFIAGSAIPLLAATAFSGIGIWPAYERMLRTFAKLSGVNGVSKLQLWKYVDFNSFLAAISGGRSAVGSAMLVCICAAIAIDLAYLFWKSRNGGRPAEWLAWAAALTWTLLLNLYVPIYDSVLVVIAIVLTLGALRNLGWSSAAEWFTFLVVILFAVSWKTETFAKAHGVQLFTVALAILGVMQLVLLHCATRESVREPASARI